MCSAQTARMLLGSDGSDLASLRAYGDAEPRGSTDSFHSPLTVSRSAAEEIENRITEVVVNAIPFHRSAYVGA